jgi:AMME syndrome candidate gene 1 protein
MCRYCFDMLVHELFGTDETRNHPPSLELVPKLPESASTPLFITWEKQQRPPDLKHYSLRGCIGTLSPRPLITAIGEYALLAALKDRRFDPIRSEELPYLRVGVSLLVNYEPCDHVHDWEVGFHGILIKFSDNPNTEYSATYLPEVAKEQW